MYCKHCGKEIADDSRFCSHCGKSQDNANNALTNKPIWIIYLIWAVSNLYLLMGKKDEDYTSEYFFPCIFNDDIYYHWNKYYYDFNEFIIYVFLLPFICYVLWIIYRKHTNKINNIIRKLLKK